MLYMNSLRIAFYTLHALNVCIRVYWFYARRRDSAIDPQTHPAVSLSACLHHKSSRLEMYLPAYISITASISILSIKIVNFSSSRPNLNPPKDGHFKFTVRVSEYAYFRCQISAPKQGKREPQEVDISAAERPSGYVLVDHSRF